MITATRQKKGRRPVRSVPPVRSSSGNVFADLRLPDPDTCLAKAELARQLAALITAAGLTQKQAAARLGVDQPKVSALLRGRLNDFSTDRLIRFITSMNHDVVIAVHPPKGNRKATVRVIC